MLEPSERAAALSRIAVTYAQLPIRARIRLWLLVIFFKVRAGKAFYHLHIL